MVGQQLLAVLTPLRGCLDNFDLAPGNITGSFWAPAWTLLFQFDMFRVSLFVRGKWKNGGEVIVSWLDYWSIPISVAWALTWWGHKCCF